MQFSDFRQPIGTGEAGWIPRWPLQKGCPEVREACDYLVEKIAEIMKGDGDPIWDEDPEYDDLVDREVQPVWDYYSTVFAVRGIPGLVNAYNDMTDEIMGIDLSISVNKGHGQGLIRYIDAVKKFSPGIYDKPIGLFIENPVIDKEIDDISVRDIVDLSYGIWTLVTEAPFGKPNSYYEFVSKVDPRSVVISVEKSYTWRKLRRRIVNDSVLDRYKYDTLDRRKNHTYFLAYVLSGVLSLARKTGKAWLFSGVDITGMKSSSSSRLPPPPWKPRPGPRGNRHESMAADFAAILKVIDPQEEGLTLTSVLIRAFGSESTDAADPADTWHGRIKGAMDRLGVSVWKRIPKKAYDLKLDLLRLVAATFIDASRHQADPSSRGAFVAIKLAVANAADKWETEHDARLELAR